jgi:DNA-binding CsgD family transcriptional regulator
MDSSKSIEAGTERKSAAIGAGVTSPLPTAAVAPAPLADALPPTARVCVEFEIDDEKCRIVCLDATGLDTTRQRLSAGGSAAVDEVARFEVDGAVYLLLVPATPRAHRAVRRESEAAARSNFLKLLTQRELQIVSLICAGCLNQQVAEKLRISEYTVGSHLKNVYVKLGLHARGELIFRCAQALARAGGASGG